MKTMLYPAPRRMSVETGSNQFYTEEWTVEGVLAYREVGGWFTRGGHDFASPAAASKAFAQTKNN